MFFIRFNCDINNQKTFCKFINNKCNCSGILPQRHQDTKIVEYYCSIFFQCILFFQIRVKIDIFYFLCAVVS